MSQSVITKKGIFTYTCGCGKTFLKYKLKKHLYSKKHNDWVIRSVKCDVCSKYSETHSSCMNCKNSYCKKCYRQHSVCTFCTTILTMSSSEFIFILLEFSESLLLIDDEDVLIDKFYNFYAMYINIITRNEFKSYRTGLVNLLRSLNNPKYVKILQQIQV
jgi:hypothetical protein